jgi:chromosome segregation ATPase
MDETRGLLQQWAATQRQISSERTDWETGKAMLEGRIQLLKLSVEETQKKIAEAKTKLEEVKKRTAETEAEKAQIKQATEALLAAAPALEKSIKDIQPRLPGVVQEKPHYRKFTTWAVVKKQKSKLSMWDLDRVILSILTVI